MNEVFIVATGTDNANILFSGWVQQGDYLSLHMGIDNIMRLPDVARVKVFGSNETDDPANLVQEVEFPTTCDALQPLRLKDQLGALLLVEFSSAEQGVVSCFVPVLIAVNIEVLEESGVIDASLTTLELLSNYAGLENFSNLVAGVTLAPGESINVELAEVYVDLTVRRRYTGLIETAAIANPSGLVCEGTSLISFVAGSPIPLLPESFPPLNSPSSTSQPTLDNSNSGCAISANILCESISEEGDTVGPCDQISDPRGKACAGDAPASRLAFLYRGLNGGIINPNRVFIEVASDSGITTSEIVALGSTFEVVGDFGGSLQVSISDVEPGGAGAQLDLFTLDTTCSSSNNATLTLTSLFGSQEELELVEFENALGRYSSLAVIRVLYSIQNVGDRVSIAKSAVVESEFLPGALETIQEQITIPRGEEVIVHSETSQINIGTKFADSMQFEFTFNAQATSLTSGLSCTAETTTIF